MSKGQGGAAAPVAPRLWSLVRPVPEKCLHFSPVDKSVSNPEEAGIKAAEKASLEIMTKAKLKAKLAAKLEAKKEIDKLLNLKQLPAGVNVTGNQSRYLEETHFYDIVNKVLISKKKITASFWSATGESY